MIWTSRGGLDYPALGRAENIRARSCRGIYLHRHARPSPSSTSQYVFSFELWGLGALVLFYLICDLLHPLISHEVVNLIGPVVFVLLLGCGALNALRISEFALCTGLFWMRIATAIYFGIGSLVDDVMNETTLAELHAFYAASEEQVAKFNLISALSSLTILATIRFLDFVVPSRSSPVSIRRDDRLLLRAGLLFSSVGLVLKYQVIFPQATGALAPSPVGAMLAQLIWLSPIGLFMLTLWSLRHARAVLGAIILLGLLDSFGGMLRFSKADAMLPLMMVALAFLHHKTSWPRIIAVGLLAVFSFHLLQPLTAFGRAQLYDHHATTQAGSMEERLAIVTDYLRTGTEAERRDFQGSLIRIAYVYAAAPAVALFDAGMSGDSLSDLPAVFVPRIFWPDKPEFHQFRDYTVLLTGLDTSATWMGYFGEAYWNLGWLGIPLVMIPLGMIFSATGRYAQKMLSEARWTHLPPIFLGMYMGMRMDGAIAGDIASSAFAMLLAYPLAQLLAFLLGRRQSPIQIAEARR